MANQRAASEHRRDMERKVVDVGATLAKRGQIGACLLAFGFLVASVTVALLRRRDERHTHD